MSEKYKFVKIGADFCGPCKAMKPIISQLAAEFPTVEFVDLDLEKDTDQCSKFSFKAIPAVFILIDDTIIWSSIGMKSKDTYISELKKMIKS